MVNKKIFMSLVVLVAIIGLASAGTFAYFSSGVSGNAAIQTGTVKLTADGAQGYLGTYTVSNVVPGDHAESAVFGTLKNDGSVPGTLSMYVVRHGTLPGANLKVMLAGVDVTNGTPTPVELGTMATSGTSKEKAISASYAYTNVVDADQNTEMGQTVSYDVYFNLKSVPGSAVITKTP